MTQVEEQILAYLDGSLAPSERETVLRTLSESPEGRRMLDAHMRMGDLLTHAAKPVSAPLETQRDLAAKIPLLAVMLPYLAGPLTSRRARSAWFGFRSWKVAVAGLATLGIIGGGLWYALSNSNSSEPLSSNRILSTAPLASNGNASSNGLASSVGKEGASTTEHGAVNAEQSAPATHASTASPSAVYHPNPVWSGQRPLNNSINNTPEVLSSSATTQKDVAPPQVTPPQNVTPSELPPIGISSLELLSPAAHLENRERNLPHYMLDQRDGNYVPLRAFATVKERYTTLPNVALSNHTRDVGKGIVPVTDLTSGFEAGIDYEIDPWFSAGVRGGVATFYQIQTYQYNQPSPYYQDLAERVSDAFVARVQAPWAGVALHYEINPQDRLHFGASAIGGFAFIPGINASPLGMFELTSSYSLLSFMALQAAVSIDASQVNPSSSAPATVSTPSSHDPLGVVTVGPNRGIVSTTAIGGRLGIVFHP